MPIRATCQCGQSFNAPDHLAGKRVKCPKCSQVLAIPEVATAAAAPARPQQPSRPQPQRPRSPDPGDSVLGLGPAEAAPRDIFSEAGLHQAAHGTIPCPSCSKPMPQQAVLCVNCGFHRQLGKKLTTQGSGPSSAAAVAPGGGGHGDGGNAALLLQRAAQTIQEDKLEELKTRSQGMPWWGYAGLLLLSILIAVIFMYSGPAAGILGTMILIGVVSGICQFYYQVMIIVHAFKQSAGQGLLVLFCPFYVFYYAYNNWNEVGNYMNMAITFWVIGFVAGIIFEMTKGALGWVGTLEKEEAQMLWEMARYWT